MLPSPPYFARNSSSSAPPCSSPKTNQQPISKSQNPALRNRQAERQPAIWQTSQLFPQPTRQHPPRFGKNTNSPRTPSQPSPPRGTNSETKSSQRKTASKIAAAKENRQPTNPQPADSKNLPRNPTTTHLPASAKTAPQPQDDAIRRGQSLGNTLCASCYSTMLVNNARKTSGDWRKTLSKMENQKPRNAQTATSPAKNL